MSEVERQIHLLMWVRALPNGVDEKPAGMVKLVRHMLSDMDTLGEHLDRVEESVVSEYPTFGGLMSNDKSQTPTEKILVQAIARISTAEGYTHMTPDEVYEMLLCRLGR